MHDQLDAELHVLVELAVCLDVVHWVLVEVDELKVRQVVDVGNLDDLILADVEVRELLQRL